MALIRGAASAAKMIFKGAGEAAEVAGDVATTAAKVTKSSARIATNYGARGQSRAFTALTVGAFAAGGVYGVGRGVRKTMIDMNKSLGNPMGFSYDYSMRRAFDQRRKDANTSTMNLTNNLPTRSSHLRNS